MTITKEERALLVKIRKRVWRVGHSYGIRMSARVLADLEAKALIELDDARGVLVTDAGLYAIV